MRGRSGRTWHWHGHWHGLTGAAMALLASVIVMVSPEASGRAAASTAHADHLLDQVPPGLAFSMADPKAVLAAADLRRAQERSRFARAVEALARQHGLGTCFGGFLQEHAQRRLLEQSVVMLAVFDRRGRLAGTASGFVVRDSRGSDGHNRLVTARHVVNEADADPVTSVQHLDLQEARASFPGMATDEALADYLDITLPPGQQQHRDELVRILQLPYERMTEADRTIVREATGWAPFDHIDAYSSTGVLLGRMRLVAKGEEGPQSTSLTDEHGSARRKPGDWGVMTLDDAHGTPAGRAAYDAIPGLSLAPVQAAENTIGMSGDGAHPAATDGYSGGPVVDDAGRVHGLISAYFAFDDVLSARVDGMLSPVSLRLRQHGPGARLGDTLPMRQPLLANPLADPRLLEALGHAGQGIRVAADAPMASGLVPMTLVGMPSGLCAAAPTRQGSMDMPMSDTRPVLPGHMPPYSMGVSPDGTQTFYDGEGLIQSMVTPDGSVSKFRDGVLLSVQVAPAHPSSSGEVPLPELPAAQHDADRGSCLANEQQHQHQHPDC